MADRIDKRRLPLRLVSTTTKKDATPAPVPAKVGGQRTPPAEGASFEGVPAKGAKGAELGYDALKRGLADAAGRANIKHALRMLAVSPGAAASIAQALLDDRSYTRAAPAHGVEGVARAVAQLIRARSDERTGTAARLSLEATLSERRAGVERERIFALEPVTLPLVLPPPLHIAPLIGFEPGVDGVRLDGEHSIHDLQTYIDDRFGRFALEDAVAHDRVIEVHHGAREEAFASLVSRGYHDIARVRTPEATMQNELYVAQHTQTGEVRYVVAEVWGANRMAHLQKLLHAANVNGRRIDPRRVEIHTEPLRRPEEIYRRTARALLASGTVPASVVIGFKNSILRELGRRAAQAKRLEFVQQALGPDPARTLRQRAHDAGAGGVALAVALDALGDKLAILAVEPSLVFRFSAKQEVLGAVEDTLKALVTASPDAAALLGDVMGASGWKVTGGDWVQGRTPEGTFIDQQVITYIDEDGAQRSLLLTKNPYGEVAHELGRVLVDNGVENVFVFGTAGALDKSASVGALHAPTSVMRAVGPGALPKPFHNVALDIATSMPELLRPPMRAGSVVANVRSPVDETLQTVDRLREAGADIVEMELSHLVRALRGSTVSLSAVYLVSDVPGTDKTIEKQANGELDASLQRAVDLLVQGLGMRGVVVAPTPLPPRPGGFEGALVLATRALKSRGIEGEQYALMRLVVARYLLNGLSDEAIGSLVADQKADALASARLASRWQEKALRELARPFSNDEVVERVRHLGRTLRDGVREIKKLGGTADNYHVHILGSILKGRAARGSDLDVLIETKDEALRERVFDSRYGYRGNPKDPDIVFGGYDYVMSRGAFYGPVLDIADGQRIVDDPDALIDIWAESIAPFGVRVARTPSGAVTVDVDETATPRAGISRETEAVAERILEHEKSYRRFIDTNFLLRHLKETTHIADVVDVPLDRLVRAGEVLARQRLPTALTRERVLALLDAPLAAQKLAAPAGKAFLSSARLADTAALRARVDELGVVGLPWEILLDGELACELMRVGDPYYQLCVDVAVADRAKRAHAGGPTATWFPFFAREVRIAMQRESNREAEARPSTSLSDARASIDVSAHAALTALAAASVDASVLQTGAKRTAGLGLTVPIVVPQPSVHLAAYANAPTTRDLSKLRVAVAADHGALTEAERTVRILKRLGVGEVTLLAPKARGEKVPYAVTSHAALSMLERGEVDRVIGMCGNGLGALDIANQHADRGGENVRPPIYGDNLWRVVDGQAAGANVLCLGGRLVDGHDDALGAFVKAFLDEPPAPDAAAPPAHGAASLLVDPEPKRIAKRTLERPIKELARLSPDEARRALAHPITIYFNPDDPSTRAQRAAMRAFLAGPGRPLPNHVRFLAWDGKEIPAHSPDERVLLLSETGCAGMPTRAWGSFHPHGERAHRAGHRNGIASFARDGGRVLDLPCAALTDEACGGHSHDLLRLFVKTFLLESDVADDGAPPKPVYGDSLRFTEALLAGEAVPEDLAAWQQALAEVTKGARRS